MWAKRAFTLIELLAVIAIIAILAALLTTHTTAHLRVKIHKVQQVFSHLTAPFAFVHPPINGQHHGTFRIAIGPQDNPLVLSPVKTNS
jgi:prepilin-type N-terminal cleavage/methylation domain-containing protein